MLNHFNGFFDVLSFDILTRNNNIKIPGKEYILNDSFSWMRSSKKSELIKMFLLLLSDDFPKCKFFSVFFSKGTILFNILRHLKKIILLRVDIFFSFQSIEWLTTLLKTNKLKWKIWLWSFHHHDDDWLDHRCKQAKNTGDGVLDFLFQKFWYPGRILFCKKFNRRMPYF